MEYPETPLLLDSEGLGEETDEVSSAPDPPEVRALAAYGERDASFEETVDKLLAMIADDPSVRDRMIVETYVNLAQIEMGVRGAMTMIQTEGMAGMMRGVFSRKGRNG